jgi:hypothetical protein
VTYFGPLDVLQFAKNAGFDNDTAKQAAAVALVATSGCDHYFHETPGVPDSSYAGLWGLPLKLCPGLTVSDLQSVAKSGQAVRELYRANGSEWGWHPAWRSDAGGAVRRTLDALNLDNLWTAKPKMAYAALEHLRSFTYHSDRIDKILSQYPTN